MILPPPPPFEPDFDVETPLWTFEDGVFISGNIRIKIIDATDEMIENSQQAREWLEKPF